MLDCFLICIFAYCALRAFVEIYYVIHAIGYVAGLKSAGPVIEDAIDQAYRLGRLHQFHADQEAIHEVSEKSFNAGRSSVMFSCLDRVN